MNILPGLRRAAQDGRPGVPEPLALGSLEVTPLRSLEAVFRVG